VCFIACWGVLLRQIPSIFMRERVPALSFFFRRTLLVNFKNSSHVSPAVCVHFSNGARRQLALCGHQLALNYPLISDWLRPPDAYYAISAQSSPIERRSKITRGQEKIFWVQPNTNRHRSPQTTSRDLSKLLKVFSKLFSLTASLLEVKWFVVLTRTRKKYADRFHYTLDWQIAESH
jgi:hypothetical protein